MNWHPSFDQHLNQFGFAITTAFLDPRPLPNDQAPFFSCSECGLACPMVIFDITIMFWTFTLVAHKEQQ